MLLDILCLKINKRVVPIKERVVGKIVPERIGVWTWQLGTPEYIDRFCLQILGIFLENKVFQKIIKIKYTANT